jgi:hypothetical protein
MYARRLLLAAVVVPAFTLSAQPQGGVPSGATIAAAASGARLDPARARSASIDGARFDITPTEPSDVRRLERLHSGVLLGVPHTQAGAAEDVTFAAERFNRYRTRAGSVWIV